MRSAGNFNSEWGYLAPAPSLLRTVRVVLVATAIGATAGAAVVVSLIDRPAGAGDRSASVAPHAIVTSAQAAPETAVPAIAAAPSGAVAVVPVAVVPQVTPPSAPQVSTPRAVQASPAAAVAPLANNAPAPSATSASTQASLNPAESPSDAAAVGPKPTGMTAMSEGSVSGEAVHAADAPDQALIPPESVPDEKRAKHHVASAFASTGKYRPVPSLGSVLRRIFNPPAGRSYYPNR